MEHQTGDNLSATMAKWRRELAAHAGLTAEVRRELEAHLEDCLAGFLQRGLGLEESLLLARQRVGRPWQLGEEFNKVMNTTSHWNRPLAIAAWAMFVVSFFLPAYTVMPGWQCALLQATFWPNVLRGDCVSIHYQFLVLANLLMLASPFLLTHCSRNLRQVKSLHRAMLAAVVLVWSFVLQLVAHHEGAGLRVGCFCWLLSFVLLYLSVLPELLALSHDRVSKPV